MSKSLFYQDCEHLDMFDKDARGRCFCLENNCHVFPMESVMSTDGHLVKTHCSPDCKKRKGHTSFVKGGAK